MRHGALQDEFRGGHRRQRTGLPGLAQGVPGALFQLRLIDQPASIVGIVVGAVERLLEAPVQQIAG